ncbi:MAG: zinc-binding protein [Planctomycetes bacterium]|jgi:uncharacterized metal-binding protein|nr:putative zinc-binding protein [Phycisphaerae bacterium]NBB95400.1 zinc-binding protein [Planctomycetota bacterium]
MTECGCNGDSEKMILIYACSGAANVAEIADRAARKIAGGGCATMFCLAGLGAGIPGMIQTARDADMNVLIDGCDLDCAKRIFERAGVSHYRQIKVTDYGIAKGGEPVTDEQVQVIVDKAEEALAAK